MKKVLVYITLFTSVSFAQRVEASTFEFVNYVPTLDNLYSAGSTSINSAYTIDFTSGSSSSNDFVYYKLNADNTITTVYYNISQGVNSSKNGISLPKITSSNGGNPVTGYLIGYSGGQGAAINLTSGALGDITADIIGNNVLGYGGAMFLQNSSISSLTGDFIGNYIKNTSLGSNTYGGVMDIQSTARIGNITGNFIANYVEGSRYNIGGAILNDGRIGNITGSFIANHVKAVNGVGVGGGALHNTGTIGNITGDFIGNYIDTTTFGSGGALNTYGGGSIGLITGDFVGNYIKATQYANGGAIATSTRTMGSFNGSFINNYATTTSSTLLSLGGAIWTSTNLSFNADGVNNILIGNYTNDNRGKIYNSIFVQTSNTSSPTISFNVSNDGTVTINDNINGGTVVANTSINYTYTYNLAFNGDGTGAINVNNDIINAGNVSVTDTTLKFGAFVHQDTTAINYNGKGSFQPGSGTASVTNLSLNNATFDINNGYLETINLRNYSSSNSYLSIDVNPDTMTSDILNINGDVNGVTKLIVNATSSRDIRGQGQILFAESTNDTTGNLGSFELYRVYGSPYLYDIVFNDLGGNAKEWFFEMNSLSNPNFPNVSTNSEVVAYLGLHTAGIEQTRSMIDNLRVKVAENKVYCGRCALYDVRYNNGPLKNIWVNPIYYNSKIKYSSNIQADIFGFEAGFDIQQNAYNKIGAFLSYRKGNYDLDGNGKKYYSIVGSNIDINSYISGAYYRYDRNRFWLFSTLYGGLHQVDIKTKDGMKADTVGIQLGGNLDVGYLIPMINRYTLEPNLGLSYTMIDYDKIKDKAGKIAKYDTIGYLEAKAGLKLEKTYYLNEGPAKIYIEPSVIQGVVRGDKVAITGLGKVDTYKNGTLGRVEVGGRLALKDGFSTYGSANYTFASSYKATSINFGINYAW